MEFRNYHKITVSDMAPHVHSFLPNENKVDKICKWLTNWIELSLDCGKIKPYDFLPSKADLAYHIGVSQGTMQNVFRLLEDAGYLESKQRIGTYIKDRKKNHSTEKLTSKRELAIEIIKKFIVDNGFQAGDIFISTRKLAATTGISNTTLRIAMNRLVQLGILSKQSNNYIVSSKNFTINSIESKTLVEKIAEKIKKHIVSNIEVGKRIPTNTELMNMFNVSSKTIHDAIKLLTKEGILCTLRGNYGTIYLGSESKNIEVEVYHYEKIEHKLRKYITENCVAGDKLPSIKDFANKYNTSEKTIKRALSELAEEGYLTFARGRYGGTFVLDIPQSGEEAYKWLAISNDYLPN